MGVEDYLLTSTVNAILAQLGATDAPVNFLGQRTAASISLFGLQVDFPEDDLPVASEPLLTEPGDLKNLISPLD